MCGVLLQMIHGVREVITEDAEDSEGGWDSERDGQVEQGVGAGMLSLCSKAGKWNTTQAWVSL